MFWWCAFDVATKSSTVYSSLLPNAYLMCKRMSITSTVKVVQIYKNNCLYLVTAFLQLHTDIGVHRADNYDIVRKDRKHFSQNTGAQLFDLLLEKVIQ